MMTDITTDITQLDAYIYTLGYMPMGESVLAIIRNRETGKIILSILFDSFEKKGNNIMFQYLDKFNIKQNKLDCIIWTHPDLDHSVGYDKIIKDYASSNTVFILPEGLSNYWFIRCILKNRKYGFRKLALVFKSWISIKKFSRKYRNVERVNASNWRNRTSYCECKIGNYNGEIDCRLDIMTPLAHKIFKKLETNKSIKGNDISISAILRIGKYGFFFGGDVENDELAEINNDYLHNLTFVKIPHHGSTASDRLPSIINKEIKRDAQEKFEQTGNYIEEKLFAVTTSFKYGRANLPEDKVLKLYRGCSEHIIRTKNDTNSNKYGVSEVCYNIYPFYMKAHDEIADASEW